ncbi:MAG TPA: HAD-IB family hydrolase [Steroidobacteraceae bacterium]
MRVAVFDLDGTITRRDTFVPYLRGWLRRHPRPRCLGPVVAACLLYLFSGFDRGRLKSGLLRACMSGAAADDVRNWTAEFVARLGDAGLCPRALMAVARHRDAGDRLVLLSASVDLYVPEIGRRLGFDETICTGVAWRDGRVVGALTTANRRGEEKRRCIESLRARFPGARFAAYGNSGADLAHLRIVEEPLLVNAGPRLRRTARNFGIRAEEWRNKSTDRAVQSA